LNGEQRAGPPEVSEVERLELLLSVAREISSILDLEQLLTRIGPLLQRVIPHEHFGIFLYDEAGQELVWKFGTGYSEDARRRLGRFPVSRGLVGKAVRTRSSIKSDDVSRDPDFLPAETESGEVPRSTLAAPLIHQEKVVGAMMLESTRLGEFSEEQEQIFSALGAILAVAIVNARLYEASVRDAAVKELLHDASREMSSILDLDQLLEAIADMIKEVVNYQLFAIYLLDPLSGDLVIKYTRGWTAETIRRYSRVKKGKGLFWKAIDERKPFVVTDAPDQPSYLPKKTAGGCKVIFQINCPLLAKDRPIGVMSLEACETNRFDEDLQRILYTLVNQIGVAIQNAQLYEALLSRERKLENDLELARELQLSMLPDEPPIAAGFEVGSVYLPAENLGGDFLDFIRLPGQKTSIVIADVSGKGVAAAMTMATARGAVRSAVEHQDQPAAVLHATNRRLFRDIKRNVYVTVCYALLDPVRGTFTYSSAGHYPPILVRENGEIAYLEAGGTVLGIFDGVGFEEETIELGSGDLICMYTDGIIDAFNLKDELYEEKRMEELLRRTRRLPATEIARLLVESVQDFSRGREQHDDMTVITLKSV